MPEETLGGVVFTIPLSLSLSHSVSHAHTTSHTQIQAQRILIEVFFEKFLWYDCVPALQTVHIY